MRCTRPMSSGNRGRDHSGASAAGREPPVGGDCSWACGLGGQTGGCIEGAGGVAGEPVEGGALAALIQTMLERQREMEEELRA